MSFRLPTDWRPVYEILTKGKKKPWDDRRKAHFESEWKLQAVVAHRQGLDRSPNGFGGNADGNYCTGLFALPANEGWPHFVGARRNRS
jgi:hypothetical protein